MIELSTEMYLCSPLYVLYYLKCQQKLGDGDH
jgi:hypothetical protein